VAEFLGKRFARDHLALGPARRTSLISELVQAGVSGGAAYDGLIASVAVEHDATLLTLDRRAIATYERLGASFLFIA
jgi:predicted nucleic acid-binding protein